MKRNFQNFLCFVALNAAVYTHLINWNFRFSTAYHNEASLDDIFDAGLVTETQVRELEQGVISESDLYEQLKPYLFGGEEPVSGVILEDTGSVFETTIHFAHFVCWNYVKYASKHKFVA